MSYKSKESFDPDWEYKRYLGETPAIEITENDGIRGALWIPELKKRLEFERDFAFGANFGLLSGAKDFYYPCDFSTIDWFFMHEFKTGSYLRRRVTEAAIKALDAELKRRRSEKVRG